MKRPFIGFIFITLIFCVFVVAHGLGYIRFDVSILLRITQPIVRPVNHLSDQAISGFRTLLTIKRQLAERGVLYDEVKRLQAENAKLQHQAAENAQLRGLLGLKQSSGFSGVTAAVVARDISGITGTVTVDRGLRDGVSPGSAVLDQNGNLLGIVREAYERSAKFLLITDGLVKVDVRIESNGALVVALGSHSVGLILDLVSQQSVLEAGDRVVTSGLTGTVPAGLLVGSVGQKLSSGSDLFQRASLSPSADLRTFRHVFIVTGF